MPSRFPVVLSVARKLLAGSRSSAADGALITTDEIAGRVIEAKGFDAADGALRGSIRDQVLTLLRSFGKQHTVEQIGLGRGVRWNLTPLSRT